MRLRSPLRLLAGAAPNGIPGVRRTFHAGLNAVFGPPPFDLRAGSGDPGLFGPGSATWRVIGEPAAIVGGIRALLVQLLHPLAMAGVADHSRFRSDPLGRLRSTSAYVTTTAFGSLDEAVAAATRVRGVHRRVRGTAPDGTAYRADSPHLLTWVSVALTSSFLAADRAFAPHPVGADASGRFVAEQSRAAALLDPRVDLDAITSDPDAVEALRDSDIDLPMLGDGTLPRTVEELKAVIGSYQPELGVNEQGREALRFLLWPELDPAVKAAYVPMLGGALATLDKRDRRRLGLPSPPLVPRAVELHARALLAAFRLAGGASPSLRAAAHRIGAAN